MGFLCHKQKTVKYISPFFYFYYKFSVFFSYPYEIITPFKEKEEKIS